MNARLLCFGVIAACASACSTEARWIPPSDPNATLTGTGPSDIWSFGMFGVDHFDGSAWKTVSTTLPVGGSTVAVAPGLLLTATNEIRQQKLLLIDVAGTVTDVTPPLPVVPNPALLPLDVYRGRGGIIATYRSQSLSDGFVVNYARLERLWRWENDHFVELPAPPAPWWVDSGPCGAFGPDDVWFSANVELTSTLDRGVGRAALVHFDGTSWKTAFVAGGEFIPCPNARMASGLPQSQSFPPEMPIVGAHFFDGARFHPLGLPSLGGTPNYFWSSSGRVATIAEFAGSGGTPLVYVGVLDSNGNSAGQQLIDSRGSIDVEFAIAEWDPEALSWVRTQSIGKTKRCVGVACGYNGGVVGTGIRAELNDGTLLLMSEHSDDELDLNRSFRLYLVKP